MKINIAIAFIGGLLTFFSPCFLPLVPAYLIYITGLSFEEVKKARRMTVLHSLLFIVGFTIVFTSLGAAISFAGRFFFAYGDILRVIGGIFVLFLGFYLMRIIKLPFLDVERKINLSSKPAGMAGTVLVGMVFALGWSPCVGPVLAGILVYASQVERVTHGVIMLIAYSLGLGLPLFLFSLAVNYSLSVLKKIQKHIRVVHFICGLFLVLVGLLLITNQLQGLATWLIENSGYKGI
jgi:cytochrome c-type biogenesis protein